MKKTSITILVLSVILAFGSGFLFRDSMPTEQTPVSNIEKVLASLEAGDEIVIDYSVGEVGTRTKSEGRKTFVKSERAYLRICSWFGLGGPEAAALDKGIERPDISIGRQEGYGALEKLWNNIKSVFWFGTFGLIILIVLAFVPATATIARTILRGIASIFPFLGSIVERIVAGFKFERPLKQTIKGIQAVRKDDAIDTTALDVSLDDAQDEATKKIVKNIKNGD